MRGYVFKNCTSLQSVTLSNKIEVIWFDCFAGCTSLKITISKTVTIICENAFLEVPNIEYHGTAKGAPWGAKNIITK